jgi:uncharacterized protein YerC
MAQVGKQELRSQTRKAIAKQMNQALFATDRSLSRDLFDELITDIEQLMLAKRLATILMLADEHSYYRIQQSLGVSASTSKRLHGLLIRGAFPSIEKLLENRRKRAELIQSVEQILQAGLPPRAYVVKKRNKKRT